MNLPHRGRCFDRITYHAQCTQCLGALAPVAPWYLVVAAPTHSVDAYPGTEVRARRCLAWLCGTALCLPCSRLTSVLARLLWDPQDLHAFRIPHGVFVKLEQGTWHAGPLFDGPEQSFYNLELADTNVTDHNAHSYGKGAGYEVVD